MNRRLVPTVLFVAALFLFTIGAANADLKPTYVLNSWDDDQERWENGNLIVTATGWWHPFYTRLDFDTGIHEGACGPGSSTPWAGDTFVGLYHQDTADKDGFMAPGWQKTRNWALVKCSAFADPEVKFPDLTPDGGQLIATCDEMGQPAAGTACVLMGSKDTKTACQPGNCAYEIQTNFHVTVDTDCDGAVDNGGTLPDFDVEGGVCLYWEAQKPPETHPGWSGNMQARYYATNDPNGGDKTINFSVTGPNAVGLSQFAATASANRASLAAWAGGMLLVAASLFIWRRNS